MQVASATESDLKVNGGSPAVNKRERTRRPRSAVTSGRKVFVDGDPNSAWTRRFTDVVAGHVSDLGGRDAMSFGEQMLVRSVAALEVEVEQMAAKLSAGDPRVDVDVLSRTASHARRLKETLYSRQLQRQPRDVTPQTLHSIAAEYAARATERPAGESNGPVAPETAGDGTPLSDSLSGSADPADGTGSPVSSNDGGGDA